MVHRLAIPGKEENAASMNPMVASLRYQCACGNQEVLQIGMVFASDTDEDRFLWSMKMMWRDMQTEVAQHLKEGV